MRQHESTLAAEHLKMMGNWNCSLEKKVTTAAMSLAMAAPNVW